MSGHKARELTATEKKEILKQDQINFGANIKRILEKYENENELIKDIEKIYFHIKEHKDFAHNPYINKLLYDVGSVLLRLTGKIPKKEYKPVSILENITYKLLFNINHERPTEKEVIEYIKDIENKLKEQ